MLEILIAIILMSLISFAIFRMASDNPSLLLVFGIVIVALFVVLGIGLGLGGQSPIGKSESDLMVLGMVAIGIAIGLLGVFFSNNGFAWFITATVVGLLTGGIFAAFFSLCYFLATISSAILASIYLSLQIISLGIAIALLAHAIICFLSDEEICTNRTFVFATPISFAVASAFILPKSIDGWDTLTLHGLDVWNPKFAFFVTQDGFLPLLFGLLLFATIISFVIGLFCTNKPDYSAILVCILILSAPIGYIFVTDQPHIHLDAIGDGMIGDKILVAGAANRLNGHTVSIILANHEAKLIKIKNNKFRTTLNTSSLCGGEYTITAGCKTHSDAKTFHLFSLLVEKISTERSIYIKGDLIKVMVSLKNPHKEERNLNLNFQLDNKVIRTESVSIPAEGFKNIDVTLNDVDVGTHRVSVGGYEASFEVKPVPFIRLNTIKHDVGIGNPLTISGTSNIPDGTKIEITIKNGVILVQNTASVMNGRFSIEIDTSNVKEGIYNIIAEEPVRKLSDSTEVTFYVQYSDIQTIGLSVSHSMVIVGDTVTVDATLKNTGNIVGTRDVILMIDGTVVQSKTVTLHLDKMKIVSFDIVTTQSDVGRRTTSVDGSTATLTVKPTPQISLDAVEDVKIGDKLSISGSTNLEDGTEILIAVEGDTYRFKSHVTTVEDGRFTKILDTADATEGVYEIIAKDAKTIHGAMDVGSVFLFSTKPTMSISLSVSSKDILVGQPEKVFARVTNSGDVREEITLSLKMDGMEKDLQTVTVEANNFNTATFEIQNPDIGTHIIDVNGYKTMFSVIAPSPILPHIATDKLSIDLYSTKTTISKGENIIVTLSAVNKITNDEDLHLQLILTVPSGISATSSEGAFSITGGQATFDRVLESGGRISGITLNLMPNEVGSYTIKGDVIYQVGDEKFDEEVYLPIFVGS